MCNSGICPALVSRAAVRANGFHAQVDAVSQSVSGSIAVGEDYVRLKVQLPTGVARRDVPAVDTKGRNVR